MPAAPPDASASPLFPALFAYLRRQSLLFFGERRRDKRAFSADPSQNLRYDSYFPSAPGRRFSYSLLLFRRPLSFRPSNVEASQDETDARERLTKSRLRFGPVLDACRIVSPNSVRRVTGRFRRVKMAARGNRVCSPCVCFLALTGCVWCCLPVRKRSDATRSVRGWLVACRSLLKLRQMFPFSVPASAATAA